MELDLCLRFVSSLIHLSNAKLNVVELPTQRCFSVSRVLVFGSTWKPIKILKMFSLILKYVWNVTLLDFK